MKPNLEIARECAEKIINQVMDDYVCDHRYDGTYTLELGPSATEEMRQELIAALTAATERDKVKQSELAMALGMFDLAYHRLKNKATRLLLTRRKLPSDYQDAVLSSYLDDLSKILNEPDPQWPIDSARAKETKA